MSEYMLVVNSKTNRIVKLFKNVPSGDGTKLRLVLNKMYPAEKGYEGDFFATDNPYSYLAVYENANDFKDEISRTTPSDYSYILRKMKMTTDEAIKILKDSLAHNTLLITSNDKEAIKLGIKALKQMRQYSIRNLYDKDKYSYLEQEGNSQR